MSLSAPLADLTKAQLADYAKRIGLDVPARASKDELVAAITAAAQAKIDAGATGQQEGVDHLGYPGQPGHPPE